MPLCIKLSQMRKATTLPNYSKNKDAEWEKKIIYHAVAYDLKTKVTMNAWK